MTKKEFVLSQPREIPASEVIARAKKAGFKLSSSYIYTLRSGRRNNNHVAPPPRAPLVAALLASRGSGTVESPAMTAMTNDLSREMRRMVITLGSADANTRLVAEAVLSMASTHHAARPIDARGSKGICLLRCAQICAACLARRYRSFRQNTDR